MPASGKEKPLKDVPGSYGVPVVGALKDRLDFYWFQGEVEFYKSRMAKNQSTVFRVNFPPGPPGFPEGHGIVLLDQVSYSVLLDNAKVDKRDTLIGSYMPDLAFTGGYRTLPYLDTAEEKHTTYKSLMFEILHESAQRFGPELSSAFDRTAQEWEAKIAKDGSVESLSTAGNMVIQFLYKTITHQDPMATMGDDPHSVYMAWTGVQFAGIAYTSLPHITEELLMHSFQLPFFPIKKKYEQIVEFFRSAGSGLLDLAVTKYGLDREEALHNLVFSFGINTRLGLLKMFPPILFFIARAGAEFQARLKQEIRGRIKKRKDAASIQALGDLKLVKATVLEVFRLMPSIFVAFGRARQDLEVESHDARYKIKKGELLGTHQYFVMRDPVVFKDPHSFVPDRFMGSEGAALLPHIVWSNGRETDSPTPTNKQCPGKNQAELIAVQFIAEMFLRYDSWEVTQESSVSATKLDVHLCKLVKRS
ncbi:hypothetical protein SELMODRAFT_183932 [Selaginella moellendorffii]|uniref:etheroleic acid synthase n=1 Tax=Selaginella moellendorffii TaxID=88036 RepID=D8SYU8_SELML|nr:allene oxide synthase 1, chloroplastic [Selaginella moellendorffii]EFJ10366.1 hypothetical protein SELMODRAFT_183932 [Selaginella moellendorffii]|eukprot:XP_002988570.1 allene oxide synthase 1, chloroplastic [Selaginella moellendorffii]